MAVGLLATYRQPWRGQRTRAGLAKAFLVTVLPFAAAEVATGVVSLLTGALSIPPLFGLGTAVDGAILVLSLFVSGLRIRSAVRADPRAT